LAFSRKTFSGQALTMVTNNFVSLNIPDNCVLIQFYPTFAVGTPNNEKFGYMQITKSGDTPSTAIALIFPFQLSFTIDLMVSTPRRTDNLVLNFQSLFHSGGSPRLETVRVGFTMKSGF